METSAEGPPAVEVEGLVVRYGALAAVDGLDLRAERGRVTAVLGPNGAGKTTTVETCEGYRKPAGGRVRVLGLDPVTQGRGLRTRIGVMLQGGGVGAGARAGETLRAAAALYAHPLDVDGLAERLGIDQQARTPFRRMSGGQQQRLRLAVALVGRPELAFLDEPTAGLDPQARLACWDLVRDLRADGVSVLLTTHLMEEAESLADHVVIVDAGRAVAAGSPEELTARGAEDTLRFEGPPGLDLTGLLAALPEGCRGKESPAGTYHLEGPVGPQLLATVTSWCAAHAVMPERLTVARRTLEDVFLDLTGRGLR